MDVDLQPVLDLIQSFGMVGMLAYLWLQERKEAQTWQQRYIDLMERLLTERSKIRTQS